MPKTHNPQTLILTNENILQKSKSILLETCSACYASPLSTATNNSILKSTGQRQNIRKKMRITCSVPQQQFFPSSKKQFKTKLVLAFMSADIPLFKLRNPQIVSLFANLGQAVPSETVCRDHIHQLAEVKSNRKLIIQSKKVILYR